MTIHIRLKEINCQKCSACFIPFKLNLPCPNCGEKAREFSDFLSELIYSMKYHKMLYGYFTPPAWLGSSLIEEIQYAIYKIFDEIEAEKLTNPEKIISSSLFTTGFNGKEYLKKHIEDIALAIYEDYKIKPNSYQRENINIEIPTIEKSALLP